MPTDNKQILTRFLQEVWTDGDIGAIDRYLAPTYTIHHDPGDPWDGQTLDVDGFKERVKQSRAPFPDQRFAIHELIAETGDDGSDKVVASWFWTGMHTGDIPGYPASGKVIEISGVSIYDFVDGRIAGHWQVTDRMGVFQQLSA